MKNKISTFVFIIVALIAFYFLRTNFSEYNLEKTVSACVLAQKRTSDSFDLKKATIYCEEKIKKQREK